MNANMPQTKIKMMTLHPTEWIVKIGSATAHDQEYQEDVKETIMPLSNLANHHLHLAVMLTILMMKWNMTTCSPSVRTPL